MTPQLPLTTRGSNLNNLCPDSDAIQKCLAFIKDTEAAKYLLDRFDKRMKDLKLDKNEAVIGMRQDLQKFSDAVEMQTLATELAWQGHEITVEPNYKILQTNLAAHAQQTIQSEITDPIKMDYGISDEAEMKRIYSVNGQPVSEQMQDNCDKLLNGWLASHDKITRNGIIYQANEKGEPKMNQGQPVKANVDELRALFSDPNAGFVKSLAKNGMEFSIQEHPYPKSAPAAAAATSAAVAPAAPQEPALETPEVPPTTPQTPEATSGGGIGTGGGH